jgi:hypothetical protein
MEFLLRYLERNLCATKIVGRAMKYVNWERD